jgi:hypothetical protein
MLLNATVVSATATVDRGYRLAAQGLEISRPLLFDEWCACGVALTHVANRTGWAIGDWLVYASGRGDYGEYYQEARAITGRSFESLSQYARVSRTFQIGERSIAVPWSFYREALRLPAHERARTLELAQANQWTKDGLAEFISTRDGAAPSVAAALSDKTARGRASHGIGWNSHKSHHRLLQCPSCGFRFEPKRRRRLTLVEKA